MVLKAAPYVCERAVTPTVSSPDSNPVVIILLVWFVLVSVNFDLKV